MSGKKDDTCGSGAAVTDELAPMRHWEQGKPTGYTDGPSHLDRTDFGDTAADPDATTDEPTEGETTEAPKDEAK